MNENARYNLLAAVSFNDAVNAGSTPEELVDAFRLAVIAERDEQIIEWLEKKAGEAQKVPRSRQERTAETIARLASKLSRGAVRSPLAPASVEYGIRVTPNGPDSEVLRYPGYSRAAIEDRLARHRAGNPGARLLQRTVRHGAWTDAAAT
ncbi:hypothetical protein OG402_41435 [Streptomyces anulatus]|uniref:hypothetical protein n=1 Tax=Streptomyces anulatus TaxID=1892 RepID=UPI002258F7E6|nr:hypothetical protein [Streptomyces anulatus]MCX4606894.1 hypothetical protein [Streptomyces anulatus]